MKKIALMYIAALFAYAGMANADTFAVEGGSITATKDGDNVVITVTGIPATKIVHFRQQGIRTFPMAGNKGVLQQVAIHGARFQLMDGNKWLYITPQGNPYKMVGVAQECQKSKDGCALEVTAAVMAGTKISTNGL
ncbi:MAG: hypothetical protein WAW00_00600 [Candidatus Moraniibacteriota bacterium]